MGGAQMADVTLVIGLAEALGRLARDRDPAAWEALTTALAAEVLRICRGVCGDAQLAQDAAQETWLLVRDGSGRFAPMSDDGDADARRWVLRVAVNASLQLLRRQRHTRRRDLHGPAPSPLMGRPEDGLVQHERTDLIRRALAELPEPMRDAIVLHHLGGLGFDQVAQTLRCPVGTAKVWVHRGLARLRRRLQSADVQFSVAALAMSLVELGRQAPPIHAPVPDLLAPISASVPLPGASMATAVKLGLSIALAISALATTVLVLHPATAAAPPPGVAAAPLPIPAPRPLAAMARTTPKPADIPIPELAAWQDHMLVQGRRHARWLHDHRDDSDLKRLLTAVDFDAAAVFFRIAERTGDHAWDQAAADAMYVYRDRYLKDHGGDAEDYQVFPDGLEMDARRGSERSRQALLALAVARIAAVDPERTEPCRECQTASDMIRLLLAAERLGSAHSERLRLLVEHALGHLRQWQEGQPLDCFQLGLTARSLIEYDAAHPDPRIAPALLQALDWLWSVAWLPDPATFNYVVGGDVGQHSAFDLDVLIAPAYAWAYHRDGDRRWREHADAAFASGVRRSAVDLPKQFNQSYWWTFDLVAWRQSH
jgi:RNA polymerase sigma factor (sigma-70 family)